MKWQLLSKKYRPFPPNFFCFVLPKFFYGNWTTQSRTRLSSRREPLRSIAVTHYSASSRLFFCYYISFKTSTYSFTFTKICVFSECRTLIFFYNTWTPPEFGDEHCVVLRINLFACSVISSTHLLKYSLKTYTSTQFQRMNYRFVIRSGFNCHPNHQNLLFPDLSLQIILIFLLFLQ